MLHYILAQVSIHYIQKKRLAFRALVMSARLLFHEVPRLFILNISVSCSVFTFACSQQQQQHNQLLFALLGAVRSDWNQQELITRVSVSRSIHFVLISTLSTFFSQTFVHVFTDAGIPAGWLACDPVQTSRFALESWYSKLQEHFHCIWIS